MGVYIFSVVICMGISVVLKVCKLLICNLTQEEKKIEASEIFVNMGFLGWGIIELLT